MPISLLGILFGLTALLYASVGFAGGSTYTALLVLVDTDYALVPILSLACNIAVSWMSTYYFWRQGLYKNARAWPMLAISAPAAFLGGLTPISEQIFIILLGVLLLIAGGRIAYDAAIGKQTTSGEEMRSKGGQVPAIAIGGGIGYISGLVGIGGGIFLAPILHLLNWSDARRIAALASAYIAINSVAALIGKIVALQSEGAAQQALSYWPLLAAVLIGGALGRRAAAKWLPPRLIKALTAALVLFVSVRLIATWLLQHVV